MEKKNEPVLTIIKRTDDHGKYIFLNIENYLKNHINEGATASQQNMAARRDSWHPINMKDGDQKADQVN